MYAHTCMRIYTHVYSCMCICVYVWDPYLWNKHSKEKETSKNRRALYFLKPAGKEQDPSSARAPPPDSLPLTLPGHLVYLCLASAPRASLREAPEARNSHLSVCRPPPPPVHFTPSPLLCTLTIHRAVTTSLLKGLPQIHLQWSGTSLLPSGTFSPETPDLHRVAFHVTCPARKSGWHPQNLARGAGTWVRGEQPADQQRSPAPTLFRLRPEAVQSNGSNGLRSSGL